MTARPRSRLEQILRAQEKLRRYPLPKRTSTYRHGTERQRLGEAGEATAKRWLQEELVCAGSDWTVLGWEEAKKRSFGLGAFDVSHWEPIKNAQNGDLYVYAAGAGRETLWHKPEPELLFSVEVKCSDRYPGVSITWHELFNSSAKYLLAVTTAGTWICTMDETRDKCYEVDRGRISSGSFYVVPHDRVRKLTIKEIIDAEEGKQAFSPGPGYESDIPF